jgi:hypothetical protein
VKKGGICPCNKSLRIPCAGFFYLHAWRRMQILFAGAANNWQDNAK